MGILRRFVLCLGNSILRYYYAALRVRVKRGLNGGLNENTSIVLKKKLSGYKSFYNENYII